MPDQVRLAWRIYYGDGCTFSSADGQPADAPPYNVQFILERDDTAAPDSVGRTIVAGSDYYLHLQGHWIGVDLQGLIDHLATAGLIKAGRTLAERRYREIKRLALADQQFPDKSAWGPLEKQVRDG